VRRRSEAFEATRRAATERLRGQMRAGNEHLLLRWLTARGVPEAEARRRLTTDPDLRQLLAFAGDRVQRAIAEHGDPRLALDRDRMSPELRAKVERAFPPKG
jgi:hypothetical protein